MRATGNKIIAELSRPKTKIIVSDIFKSLGVTEESNYVTLKVIALGNVAKAEGIDVGDNVYLPIPRDPNSLPYRLSKRTTDEFEVETFAFEVYVILGFDKADKDSVPSQA